MNPKALIAFAAILIVAYGIYSVSSAHDARKKSDKILEDFKKVNNSLEKLNDSVQMKYDTSLIKVRRELSK